MNEQPVKYGHIHAWQRTLNIPIKLMAQRLEGVDGIDGKLIDGKVLLQGFYSADQIREIFGDILKERLDDESLWI